MCLDMGIKLLFGFVEFKKWWDGSVFMMFVDLFKLVSDIKKI